MTTAATVEEVLRNHVERMRAIADDDRRRTSRLAMLNNILIYRNATSNMDVDEWADQLITKVIMEAGADEPDGAILGEDSGGGGAGVGA